ncbi:unnamed protein product, partial [Prorocentrum cordatum]
MCRHDDDEAMMSWAMWAVQRLNGARAVVGPLRRGSFRSPRAAAAALRCLGGVALGQSDGAGVADMPALIGAVVHTMEAFPDRDDVHYAATVVLGHAAAFAVSAAPAAGPSACGERELLECVGRAVQALLQLIRLRLANAETVKAACQGLAEIVDVCHRGSQVRATIQQALLGKEEGHPEPLLSVVMRAHVSNPALQTTAMWVNGVMLGAAPVVQQMRDHMASQEIQMSGVRTLGMLYYDWIEPDPGEAGTLAAAVDAVVAAMGAFPENLVLQQHACFALHTIAEQDAGVGALGHDHLQRCVGAITEALGLVRGLCDGDRRNPSSYNALFLRKEATRCIVALCRVRPSLGLWLRQRGVHSVLADALQSTADATWPGWRDMESEETLCVELLALCYVLGPGEVIAGALRHYGAERPAVVRAAADAVVELARGAGLLSPDEGQLTTPPARPPRRLCRRWPRRAAPRSCRPPCGLTLATRTCRADCSWPWALWRTQP